VRRRVCAIDGVEAHHFLKAKGPSNGSKHVEAPGMSRAGPTLRADNHQASLYLLKNAQSASRTRFVAADGSIRRLLLLRARREHLLLFVHMLIMTKSQHAFGNNAYVRSFLKGLKAQCAPSALGTVAHRMRELA